jgi:transcriptional regulator GlxA family with amidase domain
MPFGEHDRSANPADDQDLQARALDFAGPFEVFGVAGARPGPPAFEVRTVALNPGPVTARNGLSVNPTHVVGAAPIADLVVAPGGYGTRREMHNPAMLAHLRAANAVAKIMLSVCTGSLLFARAGLLTGLAATTHAGAMDKLRALGIQVRPDARVVDNGRVITSSGISAGIDMALHVVGRLLGQAAAEETAAYMQYDWSVRHVDRPEPRISERKRMIE